MPRADRRWSLSFLPSLVILALVSLLSACAQQQIAPEPPRVEAPQPAPQQPPPQVAQPEEPAPAADGYTRVALLVPQSGNAAAVGQALLNAGQMAMFDVADQRFVLQPYDTGGTPAGARAAMAQALDEGAQLILGPLFADNVRAIAPMAQTRNVNVVSFSTDVTVAGRNVYVIGLLLQEQAEALVRFAKSQGLQRFAVLAPSSDYGRAMASAVREAAARGNLAVTQVEYFTPNGPVDEAVRRLAQGGDFQALVLPEAGTKLREIAAMLPFNGIRPDRVRYMGTTLWAADSGLGREPALVDAVFPAPSPEGTRYFVTRYRETFGETPPDIAVLGYDAVAMAAKLAQAGGDRQPFSGAALTNAQGFIGTTGLFRLRPEGTVERGFAILRITPAGSDVVMPAPDSFTSALGS